jgi:hypothetical protein
MKARLSACIVALALSIAPACLAQMVVQTIDVSGINYGVKSRFTFSIDAASNILTIDVDNTLAGPGGMQGTITSFGFNTPFTNAQLGTNGSKVDFVSQTWTKKVQSNSHTFDKWNEFEPYYLSQNGGYKQDYGVGTGNNPTGGTTKNGIKHGEKATFVFKFPDFTPGQFDGFFDRKQDIVVRWQEVGKNNCYEWSDFGPGNFPPTGEIPPTPEPSTYGLIGAGALFALVVYRKRAQRAKKV